MNGIASNIFYNCEEDCLLSSEAAEAIAHVVQPDNIQQWIGEAMEASQGSDTEREEKAERTNKASTW